MQSLLDFKNKFDQHITQYLASYSDIPFFEVLQSAVLHGGKRLRPYLLMEVAKCYGQTPWHLAISIELQHVHSLIIDDIMDEDPMRRNRPSVHQQLIEKYKSDRREGKSLFVNASIRRGVSQAIALGNIALLLSKLAVLEESNHMQLLKAIEEANIALYTGQMHDLDYESTVIDVDHYLHMIALKTGTLFGLATKLGAANQPKAIQQQWYEVGYNMAIAFQIQDDVLDLTKGKGNTLGSDIINLKNSIVLVLLRKEMAHAFDDINHSFPLVMQAIKEHDIVQKAHHLATIYQEKTQSLLAALPVSKSIQEIIQYMVNRHE